MIKTIIFDLGGVLVPERRDRIIDEMTIFLGQPFDKIKAPFEKEVSSGKMTLLDMYRSILKKVDKNFSPEEALKKHISLYLKIMYNPRNGKLNLDKDVLDFVLELKKKFRVVCLTNTEKETADINKERGGIFEYFDKSFLSSDMGLRKPQLEIYLEVLKNLGNEASEVVFIDDNLEYVRGAETIGIKSVHFKNLKQLKKEVYDILKNDEMGIFRKTKNL